MADELLEMVHRDVLAAYAAERSGDTTEALRLWRLILGPISLVRESEHNGMRITRGDVLAKIRDLEKVISQGRASFGGQRIPIELKRPLLNNDLDCCR